MSAPSTKSLLLVGLTSVVSLVMGILSIMYLDKYQVPAGNDAQKSEFKTAKILQYVNTGFIGLGILLFLIVLWKQYSK